MYNDIFDTFLNNKDIIALYLQALATFIIGILAWAVAREQYFLSEKKAKQELFKIRYDNIYIPTKELFSNCLNLTNEYAIIKDIKNETKKDEAINAIKNKYLCIEKCFYENMNANRFLIKKNDYDKLLSFCKKFLSYIFEHISEEKGKEKNLNYSFISYYNQHNEFIDRILSPYFYYGKENLSFYIYKIWKYIKEHFHLFLVDYFPTFCEIFSNIIFILMLIFGMLYAVIEIVKEYLKAPISIINFRLKFKLKMKSDYLNRNRPWPL